MHSHMADVHMVVRVYGQDYATPCTRRRSKRSEQFSPVTVHHQIERFIYKDNFGVQYIASKCHVWHVMSTHTHLGRLAQLVRAWC